MIVLSWLYPRAAFWLLDRDGIKGHFGETQLKPPADDDEDEDDTPRQRNPKRNRLRLARAARFPDRHIYSLDLRDFNKHEPYLTEIRRIVAECQERRAKKAVEKAVLRTR